MPFINRKHLFFIKLSPRAVLHFCSACFILFPVALLAQLPQTHFIDLRDNQEARFIHLGGNSLWLCGTNDVCDSAGSDFFLVKLNLQTQQMQTFCAGTANTDVLLGGGTQAHTGRLVLCGETRPTITNTNALALVVDASGQVLHQRSIGLPTLTESLKTAVFLSNGDIVFTGFITDPTGTNNVWILCTDSALNTRWQTSLGGNGNDVGQAIARDENDTLFVLADSNSEGNGGYDALLIKVSPDGQVNFMQYYGNAVNNGTQGILATSDGYWLIFGETEASTGPPFNYWARKISSRGDQVWEREFGGSGSDALFAGLEYGGHFYFTGYSNSLSTGQPIDAVFCTTDTSCSSFTQVQIGRTGIDIGYCMDRQGDTLVVAGRSFGQDDDIFYSFLELPPQSVPEITHKDFLPYPNPAARNLHLPAGTGEVEVFNQLGQRVTSEVETNPGDMLCIEKLPPGVYICRAKQFAQTQRFIFIRHE